MREINIRDIWRRLNISTLLILPLFDFITEDARTKLRPHIPFPFMLLAMEYGFKKAYLFANDDISMKYLYMEFSNKVVKDLGLTNSIFYSLNERLVSSKSFVDLKHHKGRLVYKFKIPEEYRDDIKIIITGKYSKVSKKYQDALKVKLKSIPKWKNKLAKYVLKENISYSIVIKAVHLKKQMVNVIGENFPNESEFYLPFEKRRETLDINFNGN